MIAAPAKQARLRLEADRPKSLFDVAAARQRELRPLPTFEIGRPISLDLRARLLFAADPNASM